MTDMRGSELALILTLVIVVVMLIFQYLTCVAFWRWRARRSPSQREQDDDVEGAMEDGHPPMPEASSLAREIDDVEAADEDDQSPIALAPSSAQEVAEAPLSDQEGAAVPMEPTTPTAAPPGTPVEITAEPNLKRLLSSAIASKEIAPSLPSAGQRRDAFIAQLALQFLEQQEQQEPQTQQGVGDEASGRKKQESNEREPDISIAVGSAAVPHCAVSHPSTPGPSHAEGPRSNPTMQEGVQERGVEARSSPRLSRVSHVTPRLSHVSSTTTLTPAALRAAEIDRRHKQAQAEDRGLVDGLLHDGVGLASAGVGVVTGAVTGAATLGVDTAAGIFDVGIGAVDEVANLGAGVVAKGLHATVGPLVQGLHHHILPAFAPVTAPVLTPLRATFKRLQALEARHHGVFQAVPHTAPMLCAALCVVLMMLPIQDHTHTPWLFQWSITLTVIALLAWLVIELGNDYVHFRYKLLRPQWPRTVFYVLVVGSCLLALRIVHLTVPLPPDAQLSTERLQRIIMGCAAPLE